VDGAAGLRFCNILVEILLILEEYPAQFLTDWPVVPGQEWAVLPDLELLKSC